jgi:CBS domain-containing membrane protein
MIVCHELMTKPVYTLPDTASLAEARKLMESRQVRHLPIVDRKERLVGMFTQRDLLATMDSAMYQMTEDELATRESEIGIASVMTKKVATASPDTPLRQAAVFLQKKRYGCLPILTEKRVVGIITDSDFVAIAINLLEHIEQSGSISVAQKTD